MLPNAHLPNFIYNNPTRHVRVVMLHTVLYAYFAIGLVTTDPIENRSENR